MQQLKVCEMFGLCFYFPSIIRGVSLANQQGKSGRTIEAPESWLFFFLCSTTPFGPVPGTALCTWDYNHILHENSGPGSKGEESAETVRHGFLPSQDCENAESRLKTVVVASWIRCCQYSPGNLNRFYRVGNFLLPFSLLFNFLKKKV